MSVTPDLQMVWYNVYIYLHAKFHMPESSSTLLVAIKFKDKYRFDPGTTLPSYIPQKIKSQQKLHVAIFPILK
jgi:hypothetical protein